MTFQLNGSSSRGNRKKVVFCANYTKKVFYRHFTTLSHSQTAWVQKLFLKVADSSLRRHVFTSCFYRSLISFLVANFKLNGPLVLLLVGYIHMIKWWLVLCLVAGEMFWRYQRSISRVAMANDPFWDLRFFGSGESVWSEIANPFSNSLKTTHPEIDPNCTSGIIFIRFWILKYCTLLFDRARGTEMYSSACPTCSMSFCPSASILISDWSLLSG